jgi:hypothetical protein
LIAVGNEDNIKMEGYEEVDVFGLFVRDVVESE